MMVINKSPSTTKDVWIQTIPVLSNTPYRISLFASTWSPPGRPLAGLPVEINGKTCTAFVAPAQAGVWEEHTWTWESGTTNSARIATVNTTSNSSGNDFAIDDISIHADAGRDGLFDLEELDTCGTDPLDGDSDDDRLSGGGEVLTYGTNPSLPDTDGDNFNDQAEILAGKSPTDPAETPAGKRGNGMTESLKHYATEGLQFCGKAYRHALYRMHGTLTTRTKQGLLTMSARDCGIGAALYRQREYEFPIHPGHRLSQELRVRPEEQREHARCRRKHGNHQHRLIMANEVSRAIAMEPEPGNFGLLRKNVEQNSLSERVLCLQLAVGDKASTLSMEISPHNPGDPRTRVPTVLCELERYTRFPITVFDRYLEELGSDGYFENVIFTRSQ